MEKTKMSISEAKETLNYFRKVGSCISEHEFRSYLRYMKEIGLTFYYCFDKEKNQFITVLTQESHQKLSEALNIIKQVNQKSIEKEREGVVNFFQTLFYFAIVFAIIFFLMFMLSFR